MLQISVGPSPQQVKLIGSIPLIIIRLVTRDLIISISWNSATRLSEIVDDKFENASMSQFVGHAGLRLYSHIHSQNLSFSEVSLCNFVS